ncbi:uncharacterized protein G2W53_029010 [Senna tora]|uniref:GAG-pre-integrase domain-containing protein n=1 Tax=Senna tora TaxID=362788 RepID=A0A834T6E5_9FABA|nr:uncharacterized protein G2W53_029010 [Senna tora]
MSASTPTPVRFLTLMDLLVLDLVFGRVLKRSMARAIDHKFIKLRSSWLRFIGNDSLAAYSNRLEKLWNELQCLQPKPNGCSTCIDCDCGSFNKADEIYTSSYVDQFLMGLGEEYENVVSNILLMDPIPSYNKVYAMVARVERQRSINTSNAIEARHTAETYFNKHRYYDWFKEYKNQKGKCNTDSVNAAIDDTSAGSKQSNNDEDRKMMTEIIQEELKKLMKNKTAREESSMHASYFADFASNSITKHSNYFGDTGKKIRWIIDSGASSNVTGNLNFLFETKKPKGKSTVQLPDGVNKTVELVGKDQLTKKQLASGIMVKNLYVLDIEEKKDHTGLLACANGGVADLWHNRLGHPSTNVLSYIIAVDDSSNSKKVAGRCSHFLVLSLKVSKRERDEEMASTSSSFGSSQGSIPRELSSPRAGTPFVLQLRA